MIRMPSLRPGSSNRIIYGVALLPSYFVGYEPTLVGATINSRFEGEAIDFIEEAVSLGPHNYVSNHQVLDQSDRVGE